MIIAQIPPAKRGQFLGVGGHNLKLLQQKTGVTITHIDDTTFQLFAPNKQAYDEAMTMVNDLLTSEVRAVVFLALF